MREESIQKYQRVRSHMTGDKPLTLDDALRKEGMASATYYKVLKFEKKKTKTKPKAKAAAAKFIDLPVAPTSKVIAIAFIPLDQLSDAIKAGVR